MNDADSGPGSLRAAIADAASGDTIDFAHTAYGTITLTSGSLVVPDINLTIQGPGANKLTISGDENYTVFELGVQFGFPTTPANMTISGLTIADGDNTDGGSGGGILSAVNLTLVDSVLKDNQAPSGSGGGISDAVNASGLGLTIVNDLFEGNTAGIGVGLHLLRRRRRDRRRERLDRLREFAAPSSTTSPSRRKPQGGAISVINHPFGFTQVPRELDGHRQHVPRQRGRRHLVRRGFGGFTAAGGAIWAIRRPGSRSARASSSTTRRNSPLPPATRASQPAARSRSLPALTGSPATAPSPATITNSVFSGNLAVGTGNSGSHGQGGAIDSGGFGSTDGGTITISGSTFIGNQAMGENSSTNRRVAGPRKAGAINTSETSLALTSDTFSGNEAVGGSGSGVQDALGGAINSRVRLQLRASRSTTTISNSLFTGNQADRRHRRALFRRPISTAALALARHSRLRDQHLLHRQPGPRQPGHRPRHSSSRFPGPRRIGGAVETTRCGPDHPGRADRGQLCAGRSQGGDATGGTGGTGGYGWGGGIFVGGPAR